jgi:hypothetical protein
MKKLILILALVSTSLVYAQVGDTVTVQTLTFNDITKRQGTWQFPPAQKWERIFAYHRLKCDPRTAQDQYPCGEWDYLTYLTISDSTGIIDSSLKTHPSFLVGLKNYDSLAYTNKPLYNVYRTKKYIQKIDTIYNEQLYSMTAANGAINFASHTPGHIQMIYPLAYMQSLGVTAGVLSGIKLSLSQNAQLKGLQINMKEQAGANLSTSFFNTNNFTLVANADYQLVGGANSIYFLNGFNWTGSKDLLIDITWNDNDIDFSLDTRNDASLFSAYTNIADRSYFFGGNDYWELPLTPALSLDSEITIACWLKGDSNYIPSKNTTLFEAVNTNNNRVLNVHIPWGDTKLYWDAGNDNGSFDRISKGMAASERAGNWNHVAFVKNVKTGSLKVYLNGNLWHSGTGFTKVLNGITKFRIGADAASNATVGYYGNIDQFRVWNKELTSADIKRTMLLTNISSDNTYTQLLADYHFDDIAASGIKDYSSASRDAHLMGLPLQQTRKGAELIIYNDTTSKAAACSFITGSYSKHLDSMYIDDTVYNAPLSVVNYSNAINPTQPTDTQYLYQAGYGYVYDENNIKIDSNLQASTGYIYNIPNSYYSKFERINVYEIGRYITPYGINLDLGPEGFNWIYDVTDYMPLFHDRVTLSAGNQQELIDLKFVFIKGTPDRDILGIKQFTPLNSFSYRNLTIDTNIKARTLDINPNTKGLKLKTRITGHGHEGILDQANGKIHCCEWADKKHYIYINGKQAFNWSLWQNDECAMNPVYPQGGNWAPPRAGWCPGAKVAEYDFDVTNYIQNNQLNLDYTVDSVPNDNTGQGSGNYVINMDLIEYGDPNFSLDAGIEETLRPNRWEFFRKYNPICNDAIIVVKNHGKDSITSMEIRYKVSGGQERTYFWKGLLHKQEKDTITLPIYLPDYVGDTNHQFISYIYTVNGKTDDYARNNTFASFFEQVKFLKNKLVFRIKNNKLDKDISYHLYDEKGNTVYTRNNMTIDASYTDTFNLVNGCYRLDIDAENQIGLRYPLAPEIGSGSANLRQQNAAGGFGIIYSFNADFGKRTSYSFSVGFPMNVETPAIKEFEATIYPNPSNGNCHIEFQPKESGIWKAEIVDITGKIVYQNNISAVADQVNLFDIQNTHWAAGLYHVRLIHNGIQHTLKLIKE